MVYLFKVPAAKASTTEQAENLPEDYFNMHTEEFTPTACELNYYHKVTENFLELFLSQSISYES